MNRFNIQVETPGPTDEVGGARDGIPMAPPVSPLVVSVRNADGVTVGGLMASSHGDWLMLQAVCLPLAARGLGIGRRMLAMAEQEATRRGCRHAYLDGAGDAQQPFFERCGYLPVTLDLPRAASPAPRIRLSKDLVEMPLSVE